MTWEESTKVPPRCVCSTTYSIPNRLLASLFRYNKADDAFASERHIAHMSEPSVSYAFKMFFVRARERIHQPCCKLINHNHTPTHMQRAHQLFIVHKASVSQQPAKSNNFIQRAVCKVKSYSFQFNKQKHVSVYTFKWEPGAEKLLRPSEINGKMIYYWNFSCQPFLWEEGKITQWNEKCSP